jgi:hypothetical protein
MKLKELAGKLGARLDPPDADAEISSVGSIESALPGKPATHLLLSSTINFPRWKSPLCALPIPNLPTPGLLSCFMLCQKKSVAFTPRRSLILRRGSGLMHRSALA